MAAMQGDEPDHNPEDQPHVPSDEESSEITGISKWKMEVVFWKRPVMGSAIEEDNAGEWKMGGEEISETGPGDPVWFIIFHGKVACWIQM